MSDSPLVNAIVKRLVDAGYTQIPTPFRVATVSFDFTAALRGREARALDLVLLVDTTTGAFGDRDATKVRQRVEALSRALDVTGSRYVVTVILAGAALTGDIEALAQTCRVLNVESLPPEATGEGSVAALDDRIGLLLPLQVPTSSPPSDGGEGSAMERLLTALPKEVDQAGFRGVLDASADGEASVTEAMTGVLERALIVEASE
ncbi:hypothetical protein [Phenylobacterium sp.]|uniref:hypothetical protein n=1 Tax=Phenylobacterium sp. TaxID=1871053 RepID=UPI0035B22CE2